VLTNESVHESVTSLVILLRERRGPKTKGELADILGMDRSSLSHTINETSDRQRAWKLHEVVILAEYYRVSTDILLGLDEVGRERLFDDLADEYHSSLKARTSQPAGE
jgi:hypothetical protein